ncbi:nucleotidyltransferase [Serratia sp. S4]|uniref:nucleotidyltransferase domain-containing protein n=1 Tax=Serratia sp. S4 TaxID=768491 RepID=UPI00036586F4|nr:nucleotidyltransferase [Serratia sp. S4]
MSIQQKFNDFDNKIRLGRKDEAYGAARAKDDSITEAIYRQFKENGYPVIDDFIQGSLATYTAIKEKGKDFDIDRAIVISNAEAPDDPLIPKRVVLQLLEKRGFKNAKIKSPCVTADYTSEDLHIDIPVYRRSLYGDYELAVGKNSSSEQHKIWNPCAPKELIDWVNKSSQYGVYSDKKLSQFRRLVRYIKRWRNFTFSDEVGRKIYSIGLCIMFKEQFSNCISDEGIPNDLNALEATLSAVLNSTYFTHDGQGHYTVSVNLPVSSYRDIFDGSSVNTGAQLYNKLVSLRDKLRKVQNEESESKQCDMLITLFGEDFPTSSRASNASQNAGKALYATAGAVGTSQGA